MKNIFFLFVCLLLSSDISFLHAQPHTINMDRQSMWPKNNSGVTVINVCWENIRGTEAEARWVKSAVEQTWGRVANITFTGWDACGPNTRGIRIAVNNEGHPHCKGLGTELDGRKEGMELNFQFKGDFSCVGDRVKCVKFIAAHEFGHALGLAHEQNRDDCRCSEPPQGGDGGWYVTPCDLQSIMNYCNPKWNNNGKLSAEDQRGIQIIYGKKSKKPVEDSKKQGTAVIHDQLGDGQLREAVYLELNNAAHQLFVYTERPDDARSIPILKSGMYPYRIWTTTVHSNNTIIKGYGEGKLYLKKEGKADFDVTINSWNPEGYNNLVLMKRQ